MKQSNQQFRARPCKAVTLLGMSGVGKTTLAGLLPSDKWFHYSGDYRIGTRYLNEEILDQVKLLAMQQPELRQLLQNDHIAIHSNLTVHNLDLLSFFLGKLGNPAQNGLGLSEFKRRQRLFCAAEKQAMQDVAPFIRKGRQNLRLSQLLERCRRQHLQSGERRLLASAERKNPDPVPRSERRNGADLDRAGAAFAQADEL